MKRRLSAGASAEPGQWRTDRAEFQRGILDAITDPGIERVVVMGSSQWGKTELILNAIGYYIDQDPAPMLVVQPTLEMGQAFSKDKLTPMLRDTPALKGKVRDPKGRDAGNTILHKQFDGGHLTIAGANSPASLAARSVRLVFCDEIDRFPPTAGAEGDPVKLASKRATTYWNRKYVYTSSPTIDGISRIQEEYRQSDRRRYQIPCARCGHEQFWDEWRLVQWKKDKDGNPLPETAAVLCEKCEHLHSEAQRMAQVREGKWIATATSHRIAGFHLNQIISSWVPLSDMVRDFLASKSTPELLKTFVNTALGQPWIEQGETTDAAVIYQRREPYEKPPAGVLVLSAGVDVQDDRLEIEVVGWSDGHESWGIERAVLIGDPGLQLVWDRLDEYLQKEWIREDGFKLRINGACVDSGGHYTQEVYRFCAKRSGRLIYAIKGIAGAGRPIASRPSRKNKSRTPLVMVGVDTAKERLLLSWLRLSQPGPGYCHFPTSYNEEFFDQLTAERQVTKYSRGFPHREWVKSKGARNEGLDCRVYAIAALEIINPNYAIMRARSSTVPRAIAPPPTGQAGPAPPSGSFPSPNDFWNNRPF